MLKLLLGHWHIHRKKPLLLPPEVELFAEGHNDQNPVNRINPLYEATDSDEINSILSTNNDAKPLDLKKEANDADKTVDAVVQDGETVSSEQSVSENPSSKTEQDKDLQETIDPPSSTGGGEESTSSSANDVKNVNNSSGEAETVNELQAIEYLNKSFAETDTLENSTEEKLETKEQPSSSGTTPEDKEKFKHISQETPTENENLSKELSSGNVQQSEKSNSSTEANDPADSVAENDSATHGSNLVTSSESESRRGTLPRTNAPENTLKSVSTEKISGTDSNEDSDGARNLRRKAKYSYNWIKIESSVQKGKSPEGGSKEISTDMGVNSKMESSSRETPSAETKMETIPPTGILKNSLKVRARAIDELIKKFQPTSSDVKESGIGKLSNVLRKKHAFSPKVEENTKPASSIKKTTVDPEITFPPPPPAEPSIASTSKGENEKRNKGSSEGESGVVRYAVSSVKATPSTSKSVQASSRPSSSFLFSDKNGETKTVSSKAEEDAKITSSKKTEESKTTSSSAVPHGRFKKNERSAVAKRSFETEDTFHLAGGSKIVSSQKDEVREKKSNGASKEPDKPKVSKQSAVKQSSVLEKAANSKMPALRKVSRTDEVKSSDDPVPSKKETKTSKISSSGTEKTPKTGETVTADAKGDQSPTRITSEWSNVKDKVEKFKEQLNGNGDVSPKSDSLIGKSQSEDSGITRGDQISSDSQVSEKLRETGDTNNQTKESSKPANDNTSKLNGNVSSPKAKPRHNKERKRKHGHHGVTCKHCKRLKHDASKSSPLSKGNCDDYYDKVIKDGLPVHRHIRRPDSWASDMSWEEFAERDYLARLRREDRVFDKHKHLNSSFKKRLAKQRHLHRDPFHQKMHHLDEVFSHPDPYKNGGRHHRSHRRQSSLSDDGSSLHFDPYYSRTPSVCSCDECWSIPHFAQVNFGRSSVRSRVSDWNYNDLCTCHISLVPDLLEHRRKVKFAENHTHGPYNKDVRERTGTDEEEDEVNSGSLESGEHASSLSDGNSGSQSSAEGANDDAKSSTSSVRKEKATENGNGPKGDLKVNDQYQPQPWELEEWDRLLRHRLLKKRRRRAMCMGVMALAMVVFIGLVVAIVMVYLRRKML